MALGTRLSHTCLKTLNDIMQIEINKIADWLIVNKLSKKILRKLNLFYLNPLRRDLIIV
jgi:hypothetical protein